MKTKPNYLNILAGSMGIQPVAIAIALGERPSIFEELRNFETIEECMRAQVQSGQNYPLYKAIAIHMVGLVNSSELFNELLDKAYLSLKLSQEDRAHLLIPLFEKYGDDVIKSVTSERYLLDLLRSYKHIMTPQQIEDCKKKLLYIELTRIVTAETIEDCNIRYDESEGIKKLKVARATSIASRNLKNAKTVEDIEESLRDIYLPEDEKEVGLVRVKILWQKKLRCKISFNECLNIYRIANDRKWLAMKYRSLVLAYKKAADNNNDFPTLYKVVTELHIEQAVPNHEGWVSYIEPRRFINKVISKWDDLLVDKIKKCKTVDGCFSLRSASSRSQRIWNTVVKRVFKVAKTTDDWLTIDNLLGEDYSHHPQLRDQKSRALEMALYNISSLDDWKNVWWRLKSQHSDFAYKCLRRLKAWIETENGIDISPMTNGMFSIFQK